MRKLAPTIILLLTFLLVAVAAKAGTVDAYYQFHDYTDSPLNVRRVVITPLGPSAEYGSAFLSQKPIIYSAATYPSLTNGYLLVTNLITGYAYKAAFSDGFSEPTVTNYFGTNLSGTVGAYSNQVTWIEWRAGRPTQIYGPYYGQTIIFNPDYVTNRESRTITFRNGLLVTNSISVLGGGSVATESSGLPGAGNVLAGSGGGSESNSVIAAKNVYAGSNVIAGAGQFFGHLGGTSNAPSAIATNSAAATNGMLLSVTGNNVKWVSPGGVSASEVAAIMATNSANSITGHMTNQFYWLSGPNKAIWPQTNTVILTNDNTDQIYVSGAGSLANNGLYTIKLRDETEFWYVWTNTAGRYVVYDGQVAIEWTVWGIGDSTNTAGSFDSDYYSADFETWEALNGTEPVPTVTYGTNYTTNITYSLQLSNTVLNIGSGGVFGNVYFVTPSGSDALGVAGKYPFQTVTGAVAAANGDAAVFLVDVGRYTNDVTLADNQSIIGRGPNTIFNGRIWFGDNAVLRDFHVLWDDNLTTSDATVGIPLNTGATNWTIENLKVDGAIDAFYTLGGQVGPITGKIRNTQLSSAWDAFIVQGNFGSNYVNVTFDQVDLSVYWDTNRLVAYGITPGVNPYGENFAGVHAVVSAFSGTNNNVYYIFQDCTLKAYGAVGTNNCIIASTSTTNHIVFKNTSLDYRHLGASGYTSNFLERTSGRKNIIFTNSTFFSGELWANNFSGNGLNLTNLQATNIVGTANYVLGFDSGATGTNIQTTGSGMVVRSSSPTFGGTVTIPNLLATNVQFFQLSVFPTNSIPLGSTTQTNVSDLVWRGYKITVATNRAVGGWMWQTNGQSGIPAWGAFNPASQP